MPPDTLSVQLKEWSWWLYRLPCGMAPPVRPATTWITERLRREEASGGAASNQEDEIGKAEPFRTEGGKAANVSEVSR